MPPSQGTRYGQSARHRFENYSCEGFLVHSRQEQYLAFSHQLRHGVARQPAEERHHLFDAVLLNDLLQGCLICGRARSSDVQMNIANLMVARQPPDGFHGGVNPFVFAHPAGLQKVEGTIEIYLHGSVEMLNLDTIVNDLGMRLARCRRRFPLLRMNSLTTATCCICGWIGWPSLRMMASANEEKSCLIDLIVRFVAGVDQYNQYSSGSAGE